MDTEHDEVLRSLPAFPSHGTMGEVVTHGMALRDYFAAKAMPIAATFFDTADEVTDDEAAASWCYRMADAMLKARATR